jgi:erythromycin esterase-like protein
VRLAEWIAREAVLFDLEYPASVDAVTDRVVAAQDVDLLGLGEALHGSEEILLIRNRMFQRLVEKHGFSAIVIETSSPQARAIDEYVRGERKKSDPKVGAWFAKGFGKLAANRELVDWMRGYNEKAATKLSFYGFDIPLGAAGLASPRRVLDIALRHLQTIAPSRARAYRMRFKPLLGELMDWEKPEAMYDPTQSIGRTPRALELRAVTLDLIDELRSRGADPDAIHHAELARKLLDAHAALATPGAYATFLGMRDQVMAENLLHYVDRERGRGKLFVFSAGGHLKRGQVHWSLPPGDDVKVWSPAGSHLTQAMGSRYAVVGMALGASEANGVPAPEAGTIEAAFLAAGGSMLIATRGLPADEIDSPPPRSGSALNPTYYWLTPESFSDFEWLMFLESTTYPRGAQPLSDWG